MVSHVREGWTSGGAPSMTSHVISESVATTGMPHTLLACLKRSCRNAPPALRKPNTFRVRGKIKKIASREPVVFLADRKTACNCSSFPLKNPPAILQIKLHLPVSACYPLRARCLFDFACAHVGTVATRAPTRLGAGRSWAAVACKNLLACSGPARCHSRGKYKYRCLLISHACMWERCFF